MYQLYFRTKKKVRNHSKTLLHQIVTKTNLRKSEMQRKTFFLRCVPGTLYLVPTSSKQFVNCSCLSCEFSKVQIRLILSVFLLRTSQNTVLRTVLDPIIQGIFVYILQVLLNAILEVSKFVYFFSKKKQQHKFLDFS